MGKTKRKLSSWNLFVMDVKKKNPTKSFKEVLVLASKLKKQGAKVGDYVQQKTAKVVKKLTGTSKRRKKGKGKKRRKSSKKN
jgi:hypothetical protein|tara:strand:- start:281 stop:526 length:246 start_codon:yes stop_codon:yes gene_type:complete